MTQIKQSIKNFNSDKLDEALWPNADDKPKKPLKTQKKLMKFIAVILSLGLVITFSLGSFAVDITLLLFLLMLILSHYKKYPF